MVEIIRRGEIPEERWYEHTCKNCSTVFKFQRNEATASPDQRDPGYFIRCPLCRKDCWMTTLKGSTSRSSYGGGYGVWDR